VNTNSDPGVLVAVAAVRDVPLKDIPAWRAAKVLRRVLGESDASKLDVAAFNSAT